MSHTPFTVRCRGIIVHEGKLLVVEHAGKEGMAALPGGHLEAGEAIVAGLCRELEEELGVVPVVGPLLYVHTFSHAGGETVEFLFWVENGADFVSLPGEATHGYELASCRFVAPADTVPLLRPVAVWADFVRGQWPAAGEVVFLSEGQRTLP